MRRFRNTIRKPATVRRTQRNAGTEADATLDLHGKTADEAIARLTSALNDSHINTLLVVHGKGEGILRRRTRAFLRSHPEVREVRNGEDAGLPGGDGVTWCRLSPG
jgi:DNA mismatch repair protein MutS2